MAGALVRGNMIIRFAGRPPVRPIRNPPVRPVSFTPLCARLGISPCAPD